MKSCYHLPLLLACPLLCRADTAVFTDDFANGSTLNGISTPGGTAAASSTSYDIASTRAAVSSPAISAGDLTLSFDSAGTGFVEAQALFSGTPVVLSAVGDYINLTVVFTDNSSLFASSSAYLFDGLYGSGGSKPLAGSLANAGLNAVSGSAFATGNAASWSGYVSRTANFSGGSQTTYRNPQTGGGTTSANQDLVGNNVSAGAYDNPAGVTGTFGSNAFRPTAGSQYTLNFRITLSTANSVSIADSIYNGAGLGGGLITNMVSSFSGANFYNSFDGLAVGVRNNSAAVNPIFEINSITVTVIPEPGAVSCGALGGAMAFAFGLHRRNRRKTRRPALINARS